MFSVLLMASMYLPFSHCFIIDMVKSQLMTETTVY